MWTIKELSLQGGVQVVSGGVRVVCGWYASGVRVYRWCVGGVRVVCGCTGVRVYGCKGVRVVYVWIILQPSCYNL